MLQHRSAGYVLNRYDITELDLNSLQYCRHQYHRLAMLNEIKHGLVAVAGNTHLIAVKRATRLTRNLWFDQAPKSNKNSVGL